MPNDPEKDREDGVLLRFQDRFDLRYVLRDGVWKLVIALVFGMVTLILTIVGTGIVAGFLGKIHL